MATRSVTAPKAFREGHCIRCDASFQSTGPNCKRCEPCRLAHKQQVERDNKRAKNFRRLACVKCSEPFPPNVHGHQRWCSSCAVTVRRQKNNVTQAKRHRIRYRRDSGYRLHLCVATMLRRALRLMKPGRQWEAMVGYSVGDLSAHLERQFSPGMTWANYGIVWEIDHITPSSTFSFKTVDDPEFRACWALSNLRPLGAKANRQKNSLRTHLL